MAGKDIELVIKARDRASAELDKISKALKKNVEDQLDLAKGAGKTSAALGKLTGDAAKFQSELNKLQSAGKVAVELDKATAAVTRMEGSLKSNASELAKLARESDNAAQATSRLKGQLAAEESNLAANKTALDQSKSKFSELAKEIRNVESAQRALNATRSKQVSGNVASAGVGREAGAPVSSARQSAATFLAADLASAKAAQAIVNQEISEFQGEIKRSTDSIKNLRPQLSAASSLQNQLANETSRASTALKAERDDLGKARSELDSIRGVSAQAGAALGGVAVSQEAVSAAAQRMAANLAAAKARIEGLSNVKTTSNAANAATATGGVDVQALATQRRAMLEARKEWVAAQNDVKALGQQMRATAAPTEQLGAAFGAAQAKARLAKQEYEQQRQTLVNLGGSARSSFNEFSQAANQMRAAGATTAGANNQIAASANSAADAQRKIRPAIRDTGAAAGDAANRTNAFSAAFGNLQKDTRQTLSLMQRLRGEVLSLTASYIGFQAALSQVSAATDAFRQLEAVQSRLGAVYNQDTSKVGAEIQFLQQEAARLGISFGTLADEYGKFAIAAQSANFTTSDTRKIFLSVAEAARVNKLSVEQTSGVFLALTQMISKGKVSSEELRRQLGDRLPGAFNIFAKAIGVTTAELDKMMQQGEVLADRGTLLKFADELSRRFGPQLSAALDTVSTDIGRFQNNMFNAQVAVANGFIPSLRLALQSFNEFSQSTEGQDTFRAIGKAVGDVIVILAELPKYFDLITLAAKAFIAVKIAEVFTGMIGRVIQTTGAISAFSRELQFIGPRTQQAAAAQGVFTRGLAQTVSTLGSFRQNLLASTSQTALARVGVLGLAGAVGGLQTILITTAGAARALLAAFGGPIGIAITALTLIVGNWLTSIDKATAAVTEHKRQVDIVVAAYNSAGDKAGDWAKKIAGVTMAQALASVEGLRQEFQKTAKEAEAMSRVLAYAYNDFPASSPQVRQLKQLQDALKGVREGTVSIKDLENVLNEIALNPSDEQFKQIALEILNIVNNAKDGETSLKELGDSVAKAEAQIRLMNGTASEADKVLLGVAKATEETTVAFDKAGAIKTYTEAIDTLKSKIPGLAEEMKKLKDITEVNKTAWEGLVAAWNSGDYGKIGEILKLWAQARGSITDAYNANMFSNFPGGKDIIDRIIYVEGGQSGNGPGSSSARGIGQFTEGTWLRLFNRVLPELSQLNDTQKLALRTNEEAARKMLEALTKENQAALANAGINVTPGNTYLAHFLGSGDAVKVLLANPDELAKNIVQADSVKANPNVIKDGTTARDLINWANQKMGGGSPIMAGGQTKQENFDENIAGRVKGWKDEANARKESNREAVIARALAEAENEARKQGVELSQQQRDAIREAAGAKYDSAHADEQLKKNQEDARNQLNDIIGLDQQRKVLLQEIQMAQNAGDGGKTAELSTQLQGVNDQLAAAIPKALELARALGDEKMVAQLQKVQLNTAKIGTQFSFLGLSFNETKQLAVNFADGLVNAFDSFAQSVANGEDAMKALGRAFLQFAADFLRQIATMILKAMIFRALNAAFPGLGIGVGAAHTGGLVGSVATGTGNTSRQVSPMWFMDAMRYHTGGIAGLRPDEVPAVLKKNEEIITEQDPRHRFNGNGQQDKAGISQGGQPIKQVLVMDQRELANAVASSHGEKVVITHIKNNAATIRKLIGG